MKEITIVSGKGGTGKTTVAAALASVASNVVFCDNDVDAADLHLIFHPRIRETYPFDSGCKAVIDPDLCTGCGICDTWCRFDAINVLAGHTRIVNPFSCEGCRLCARFCPENAIALVSHENNHWFISDTRFGVLVHAEMAPGEENSGKLVTEVRRKAREIAMETKAGFVINDGPPGIGCAAIASVTGADMVLLVIEPTISGLHDAERMIQLAQGFHIPVFALINKYDINPLVFHQAEKLLEIKGIPLAGQLPFSEKMVESMIQGQTIAEYLPDDELSDEIRAVWKKIAAFLN